MLNKKSIYDFYKDIFDESKRLSSQAGQVEYLTTMRYLNIVCPKNAKILDACAGTGVYAFPLAQLGHEVTAGDLVPSNVDKILEIQEENPVLKHIYTGSILDLSAFEDETFDVVLNLGSYYHFKDINDRYKSIKESLRVLKEGGIFCLAYLNKYANYAKFSYRMNDEFEIFEEYIDKGYNEFDGIFWATTPEDVEDFMKPFIVDQMHNIATDGAIFTMKESVEKMNEDIFKRWLKIHFENCEVKSILGYSEHGLYIGRKQTNS